MVGEKVHFNFNGALERSATPHVDYTYAYENNCSPPNVVLPFIQISFSSLHKSIHISKFYLIIFYHLKKLFYQLYHTILQYSQHSNFYFTIQHIKIIFLHNKIIYPKTQIKTKTQNPMCERERERGIDKVNKILGYVW